MAHWVQTKQISPVELVAAAIQQVEKCNPAINAMAENLFQQATQTAREVENAIFEGHLDLTQKPLLGVPFTVKEMFAVTACKRTAGNIHYKNEVMNFDSSLVKRLKEAGAIPICTTNVPELGLWFETDNVIYGRTNNPYDLKRTSGGSTGGDAALIASLASPFGIGSDIGGSIRMPAAFCGLFGHKPTWRRLPKTGHFPSTLESIKLVTEKTDSITTMGFLTRDAKDLSLLMEILSGPDGYDPLVQARWTQTKVDLNPKLTRVYILENPKIRLSARADQVIQEAVKKAGLAFQDLGFQVESLPEDFFLDAFEIWSAVTSSTQTLSFYKKMTRGGEINLFYELLRVAFGQPRYTFPALITCVLNLFKNSEALRPSLIKAQELQKKVETLLGSQNIVLMPVHPRVAPRHQMPYLRPFDFSMTGAWNPFGVPTTAIPMGLDDRGLPLSVQVIAGFGQDHLNFAVAEILEKKFGGFKAPKMSWKTEDL